MKIGEKLHGFVVSDKTFVRELGCEVYTLRHEKCRTRLTFIDREDDNKTFSVAFKTLPEDSTGVFHIIEHSVLCGSEKYPVKDPFVELLKGSLNTFLNAMTFQDKTMYPVSSRNDKDFLNLVDIYMDAVLHPLVLKDPNAFYQEGWHYELDEKSGEISYKGVVLNEMRGDYSSPETVAERHINEMLYEGTPYAEDSGGDPSAITELTYEQFCRSHSKYYHPTHAEIMLDGSVNLDEVLPLLDSYLAKYSVYDGNGEDRQIPSAKISAPVKRSVCFEAKPGETPENKNRITEGYLISRFDDQKKLIAANVLLGALFLNNESPAKKAIIDSGLCEDVSATVRDGIFEPCALFEFVNVKDGKEEELLAVFRDTVRHIAEIGIDRDELVATLNSIEFKMREKDYGTLPLGVVHAMISLESLLYSDDPVQNFRYENALIALRGHISDGSGYYESLLCELFLKNERRATLIMHPSLTLADERLEREKRALSEYSASLSGDERVALVKLNRELLAWQENEDSEEAKATIPTLTLSDIPDTVPKIPIEVFERDGVRIISHDIPTAGIIYTDLYFDISDMTADELPILSLYNLLLTNLATEKRGAVELQRLIKTHLGGFDARMTALTENGTPRMYLQVGVSALETQKEKISELACEILNETLFEDTTAIKNIVRQTIISLEESFAAAGHQVALARASAASSVEAAAREYYGGYEAYIRLKEIDKNFDSEKEEIKARLTAISEKYVTRERLTVSITGMYDESLGKSLVRIAKKGGKAVPVCNISPLPKRKEGILIPAQVGFASAAYNLASLGEKPTGSFDVVRTLVGYEFLWVRVRVRGGAYGAGMSVGISGNLGFYSYRDPTPDRSLVCYGEIADFLRDFAKSGGDITKYIIGAVGDAEPVRTPRMRGSICTARYLRGISYEDSCEIRRSLLATDAKELIRIADIIEKCVSSVAVCVVAGKEKLDAFDVEFDEILKI